MICSILIGFNRNGRSPRSKIDYTCAVKRLPWPTLLALSSFSFAVTLVTNTLDPAVFGHLVLRLAPEAPNTLLGYTTFAASVLAIITGPIVGVLSDRTHSRLGPRLPFFLAGVPIMIAALYVTALASSILVFVLGVMLYRLGDNLILPVWQALYPELVPARQRGLAAGLKSFLEILAVLVGRFSAGELMGRFPELGQSALLAAVSVPAIGLLAALWLTWRTVRRHPWPAPPPSEESTWQALRRSFHMDWRGNPGFTWWFINRALFWTGFVILGTFLLLFIIDVIGLPEAEAQRFMARLSAILGGAILLIAVPSGRLADRWGRKPLVMLGCALAAIGTVAVLFVREPDSLMWAGGLIGIGSGVFISANFAMLSDIVPVEATARFLGIANIASAGGGAVARLLGGLLVDPINAATATRSAGYLMLYAIAALCFLLSWWSARHLPVTADPAVPPKIR